DALTRRMREVHVTLATAASTAFAAPPEWLQLRAQGNVLSFIDIGFDETTLQTRLAAQLAGIQRVETQALPLRSIFTTYARAMQNQGVTP
ncbi:MAG TPA: hypothetical protein VMH83_01195, partial [Candidatus Acidoferrum sp.]|nr:hypothetical protein [Candidatus Acidoferrum sp.]